MKKTILTIVAFVLTLTIFAPFTEAKETLNIKELKDFQVISIENFVSQDNIERVDNINETDEDLTEEEIINEMAEQLKFLYTEAATVNKQGEIIKVDVDKVEAEYGSPEPNNQEAMIASSLSVASFGVCIVNSTGSAIGLDVVKRAYNKQVKKALKSHAWKKASSIMYNNIKKYLGKSATKFLIKKLAGVALPGGLPMKFAFIVAKCGVKEII
ncbi:MULTISPECIES: hypothetical protein [Bacillus]|nr:MULTISPECIES: hypothetical protein [Bacillus]KLV16216.1 hypothetical protein ABW03_17890 [Bacillus altitudinis]MCL6795169.1 hypothetical protein [Bacillus altitudinis]MCY7437346.1 hypothetical protein [Bacillus altitudinis]MCY7454832.1 hypothetical protein [Bacillus altitudinis]MEC1144438.1 hypothetical protein [Bacillus altitudinis]